MSSSLRVLCDLCGSCFPPPDLRFTRVRKSKTKAAALIPLVSTPPRPEGIVRRRRVAGEGMEDRLRLFLSLRIRGSARTEDELTGIRFLGHRSLYWMSGFGSENPPTFERQTRLPFRTAAKVRSAPLDAIMMSCRSELNGRCGPCAHGGKSGLPRTRWWVTPTVRKNRDSATENRPPRAARPR
jgi:hypothetical protein